MPPLPTPDFAASMLRVLTTLDELAAIFARLDAELRQLARAGIADWTPELEDDADA